MTCHFCGRALKSDWLNAGGDVGPTHRTCFVRADLRSEAIEMEFAPLIESVPTVNLSPVKFGQPGWLVYATELRRKGMGCPEISRLTQCSHTTAHKYLFHILKG